MTKKHDNDRVAEPVEHDFWTGFEKVSDTERKAEREDLRAWCRELEEEERIFQKLQKASAK